MSTLETSVSAGTNGLTNGSGAAAILATGVGSFALAALAVVADRIPSIKHLMIFYKPTGPLSGVTTVGIIIWLAAWGILEWLWRNRTVPATRTNAIALILLILSLLLTFPPFVDLF